MEVRRRLGGARVVVVKPKKPRVTDAKFEIVQMGEPRTWGERQASEWNELNWFGKIVGTIIVVVVMTGVAMLARALVGLFI